MVIEDPNDLIEIDAFINLNSNYVTGDSKIKD